MAADKPAQYIVDSSSILSYILPDETLPNSIRSIIKKFTHDKVELLAPTVLLYEVGNALKSSVRQNRLDPIKTSKIYSNFLGFPIQYLSPNYHDTLDISLRYDLSFYDASYLSLALEKNLPLLTLDKKLLACLSK
jgi:predicted nucleic acid-binding protein